MFRLIPQQMYSVLALVVAGIAAADRPADTERLDEALIQGTWEYVSVQVDGQRFPLEKGDG